ncbi:group 1 glycosyl transferase [Hyphomicrobium denitrificans 1NES1]|uniref:Group 1 glycosyl transferase n=1 Tax=Hyphomicrobium denitrificans 1NES1 TaxID=670307 RepID=N0BFJ1_9HYPH|nr:glycosyltransferase family 1 protein [Hyphomicrobium denitrificans]AGK59231.1 group 1 glycosyl transferase [Hyphomicrobium denitrificans 1NES1]
MRILIATDAWRPQINGVVRTYENLRHALEASGHQVTVLSPSDFMTLPCPGYREIRLALPNMALISEHVLRSGIEHIHIATEGPIGWAARAICLRYGVRFTTSFHTRFPEYLEAYIGLPASISYRVQRRFHSRSIGTFVATPSLKSELERRGFERLMLWARGVDTALFRPMPAGANKRCAPTFLYVGRVSREKNVEAFLNLGLPGRKVVVGDGPLLPLLRTQYPTVDFKGAKTGDALAAEYSAADVFVFPSRTDTFGLVLLEAMAAGVPIAAHPVMGPIDIVTPGVTGILSDDLRVAALLALELDPLQVRAEAMKHDWSSVAEIFVDNIYRARGAARPLGRSVKTKGKSPQIKQSPKPVA